MTDTTPDYARLIERLEKVEPDTPGEGVTRYYRNPDGPGAAAALRTLQEENEALLNLVDRLRIEAQAHAMEARGANATIHEAYQAATEGKGEPGNWHGAGPIKDELTRLRSDLMQARARYEAAEARVKELETLMRKAHAVMRECGWQLAISAEPQGDGILEAACTEIEADFADALSARALKENGNGE